ncbi:MAG: DUF5110 domain-containing protein [Ignavibacteria bacterium]|jgi:alpha-glucosidase (family GH31 glycosyl hydrolase)|nr:DUF5110 domain-containing protein [Ignavibacteria bacterium]MCU7501472.1 DUF5110 domain-containing protein [Ignavibacteria bacterium]MCU7516012.1 DUF5110 domain-containing protein [Ignavibacteria bacterium]
MKILKRISLAVMFFPIVLCAQVYTGNFTSYSINGKAIVLNAGVTSIRLTFFRPEIVKVDFIPSYGTKFDSSLTVVQDTSETVPLNVKETDSSLEISSARLKVVCSKYPLRLSYYNAQGKLILKDRGGFSAAGSQRSVEFQMQQDEHFYGTGERGSSLDKQGQAFSSFNTQVGGYNSAVDQMMINVPYVISSSGYSIYFENTYPGYWNFGQNNSRTLSYRASDGELSYYIISNEGIAGHLEEYTWLTGRQPLPPRWAFGFIQSKFGYRNEDEARAMVQTMQQKNLPLEAIVLDLYWFKNMGDLSWNLSQWKDPFGMMSDFLSQGVKTIVITEPYVTESSPNFSVAASQGYFAKNSQGAPYVFSGWWSCGCNAALLDLTSPQVQKWWWNLHPPFMGSQMAGIWTDLGEPERDNTAMQYYLGGANKVHNIYNLLWAKTIFEGFSSFRPGERLVNLTRSGYAGIQRYSVITWSGDVGRSFGGLQVQIPLMLNMGLSGFGYHNSDIGGFTAGFTTPELYARWMQFGAFSPVCRAHGTGQDTEPWVFGAETESISRKFIQIRFRLIPYIYTMAHENFKTGMPIARPLLLDYPNDPRLYNLVSSYMFGSSILVSPVTVSGMASQKVYLPEGSWVDFWDDRVYTGNQEVIIATPLEKMPVFVKSGSIIPMQPLRRNTEFAPGDTLFFNVYPSLTGGEFRLYEDDGKTLKYQKGEFSETVFSQKAYSNHEANNIEVSIGPSSGTYSGKPPFRTFIAEIHLVSSGPESVHLNARALQSNKSLADLRSSSTEGFFFDATGSRLFVQLKAYPDSSYKITADNLSLGTDVADQNEKSIKFHLEQNYPNPFNPATKIKFSLAERSFVKLNVYDILGRRIASLVNEEKPAGSFEVNFDAQNLPSGIYIYELNAGQYRQTRKMNLVR